MIYNDFVKKILFSTLFVFCLMLADKSQAATVNLSTDVQSNLNMSLSSASISFGSLVPGTPVRGSSGIDIDVTTSAADGYNLSISDGVAASNSALLHTDTTTRIVDFTSLIASPSLWSDGVSTGLGFTTYYGNTTKEVKWGSGTVFNDANNKYAGIPQNTTVFHASAGYKASSDRTSIAFILDVPADQKTGSYSGDVTISATAIIP